MAFTTATINDVAKDPGGGAIPFALVISYPRNGFSNGGTEAAAHSAVAGANGVFSLAGLECTDDAASTVDDPHLRNAALSSPAGIFSFGGTNHVGSHHVKIIDPRSGEHVYDIDVVVPHTGAPTNLATLSAQAV